MVFSIGPSNLACSNQHLLLVSFPPVRYDFLLEQRAPQVQSEFDDSCFVPCIAVVFVTVGRSASVVDIAVAGNFFEQMIGAAVVEDFFEIAETSFLHGHSPCLTRY